MALKNKWSKIDGVVLGLYSGWDSFLLKYGCEVFVNEVSSVWVSIVHSTYSNISLKMALQIVPKHVAGIIS
jgi:hypothetical protein